MVMDSKERETLTVKPSMTFSEMKARFSTEEACKELLVQLRWPDGVKCPRCGNPKPYKLNFKPFHWQCRICAKNGYRFSVLTKTVFENTNYPLKTWFEVIYLMTQSKKGISALQIHRQIGSGSYETAWYMCTRIRAAMKDEGFPKLMGQVEVDESYIGGKDRNRHKGKKSVDLRAAGKASGFAKVGVIGAIERKGNVVARVIGSLDAPTLSSFVNKVTDEKVSLVPTEENQAYNYVRRDLPHESVNHSKDEWVRGEVHTNNIESFWSLIKRGIMGSYHNVSKKYLPLYLAEFQYRFNNRKNPDIFFDVIAGC
jgi:transposase-like protein